MGTFLPFSDHQESETFGLLQVRKHGSQYIQADLEKFQQAEHVPHKPFWQRIVSNWNVRATHRISTSMTQSPPTLISTVRGQSVRDSWSFS